MKRVKRFAGEALKGKGAELAAAQEKTQGKGRGHEKDHEHPQGRGRGHGQAVSAAARNREAGGSAADRVRTAREGFKRERGQEEFQ